MKLLLFVVIFAVLLFLASASHDDKSSKETDIAKATSDLSPVIAEQADVRFTNNSSSFPSSIIFRPKKSIRKKEIVKTEKGKVRKIRRERRRIIEKVEKKLHQLMATPSLNPYSKLQAN